MHKTKIKKCGVGFKPNSAVRPIMSEATALGAAMAAGFAEGIEAWDPSNIPPPCSDEFYPSIDENERDIRYVKWKKGIVRSMGWEIQEKREYKKSVQDSEDWKLLVQNFGVFAVVSFSLLILAKKMAS